MSTPQTYRRMVLGLEILLVVIALFFIFRWKDQPQAAPLAGPRLVVLVYFDQLRGDYLQRWDELFVDNGFHRLERESAWFQNCHYPYAYTVTAAGHASVATGTTPDRHGIVGNEWYVRSTGTTINSVDSASRYDRVPPLPPQRDVSGLRKKASSVSPENLLVPTFADALKKASNGKSKVVALSIKDRSAVLPGGQKPDACYWFDDATGEFVTSTYYRERIHDWVAAFNASKAIDRWETGEWDRLRPDLDYVRYSGPDEVPGEGTGVLQGHVFPHPFVSGPGKLKVAYYNAVCVSPFGNELLLDLAKRAIDAEELGRHEVPDFLSISFSSNDLIGHVWGPDSQEVLDVTLRSDLIVRDLLAHLDATVGKGNYVLALTADHGICPLPEVSLSRGTEAGRIPADLLGRDAEAFLNQTFGAGRPTEKWLEAVNGPWVYLNQRLIKERRLTQAKVESALAGWLKEQTGIQTVYTRSQLTQRLPESDELGRSVQKCFYAPRSGDLMVVIKPYYLLTTVFLTGTNHGTPHGYDTHVPLLIHGPGIRPGARKEPVTPLAAAAILSRAAGIAPPSGAQSTVSADLFEAAHGGR